MVEFSRIFTESMVTKSSPKLSLARVLVAWVWMPAGDLQRRRLYDAVKVFLSLRFQSSSARAVCDTGGAASRLKDSAGSKGVVDLGCCQPRPEEPSVGVLKFRKVGLEKIDRPGKLRRCSS